MIIKYMIIDITPSLSFVIFWSLSVSLTSFVGDFDDYNLKFVDQTEKSNEYNKHQKHRTATPSCSFLSIHTF